MPKRTPSALAATLVLALAAAAQAADVITLVAGSKINAPGGQLRGDITAESPNDVRIKPTTGGAEQVVPVDQIDTIAYDQPPPSLALADARMTAGDLAQAVDLYKKAATEAAAKPPIAQYAQFQQASALAQLGAASPARADEAIRLLEAFVKAHPNSRHLGRALETLVRLQLQKGDADAAERDVAALERIKWAADKAAVLRAEVLSRRGKHDEAVAALDRILAAAPKDSAQARDARLAKAKDLAALKKFAEAEALVREVIKDAPPEDASTQALAHNTLGDCLRAANRPKDALFAYLQTDVLYDKDKEQHPRALHEIAQLWGVLKRDDRADEVMERLRQQYPQSPYAAATK